ncbi:MAG: DNA repair protein RecN [Woeseia sp.]|nr:DNA repair protein RecN [Woeseia sp.]
MLTSLQVRNFAIVDEVEVDFEAGMTVLTGETGAGKSILVDALALVLGERGSAGLVREGTERADISAQFDVRKLEHAREWLIEQALDSDDDCVLRRVIGADGRSRAFVNGTATNLQGLKQLGELLLDIHGQHFHQSLARRDVQRELLDHFGGLTEQARKTAVTFDDWQTLAEELRELENSNSDKAARLELLEFQIRELDGLDASDGELEALQHEREKLLNSGRIADGLANALQQIYEAEQQNAHQLLARAQQTLEPLVEFDTRLATARGLLAEAVIQVAEAADQLQRCAEDLDADPARREWVEDRLDAIKTIARKHKLEPTELATLRVRLGAELESLQNIEQRGAELASKTQQAAEKFRDAAAILGKGRQKAAKKLAQNVTNAMADLGMPGGVFEVRLSARADDAARAYGMEDVEYLISANPGQSPQPLAKIASGGELSRMSLAIQVIVSDGSSIPTMIFDEVDSGVGGGIAEMVGRRLGELANSRQVLCVTHLPQVASQAHHHLRVNKLTDGKSTRTTVSVLQNGERVEELARMLGGVEITGRTREHAAEMLERAGNKSKKKKKRAAKRA